MEYSKEDMNKGLDCYWPEIRVFPIIAKTQRDLAKRDILLILKWKLSRIKTSNSKTVEDEHIRLINEQVKKAGEAGGEVEALKKLDEIPGIGLATATAILTICHPEKFTILDWRVLGMLHLEPKEAESWTAEDYFNRYLPRVKDYCEQWECTLRQADQALWGLSVSESIDEIEKKATKDLA